MQLKPIKTDADHEAALREIERLWGAAEGTVDGDQIEAGFMRFCAETVPCR
jgi:HTH-type transcriptional regulator/antitoxin HigA